MNIEEELLKLMPKEELNKEVARTIGEFQGFLTKQAALKIIAIEKGILKKEITSIKAITPGSRNINLSCTVSSVFPLKKYPTGNRSRIVRVEDATGSIDVILWNEDADEAAGLKAGDEIEILNAYEKNGRLAFGYAGYFKIIKRSLFTPLSTVASHEGKRLHIRSFVSELKKEERPPRFVVSDGAQSVECVFEIAPERIEKLKEGKEIVVENCLVKNGKIIIDSQSRLLVKRENILAGVLEKMEASGDGMQLVISGKSIMLSRKRAFDFLGVKEVAGVSLSTIINLKRNMFIGRNVVVEIKGD